MTDTLEKVRAIVADEGNVPVETIDADSALEALGIDSLGAIEVLFRIEDEFKIRIPQDRAGSVRLTTVQDVVDVVERLVAEQRA